MIQSVEEYLDLLKTELKDTDIATTQDALADAEEHLRAALANMREKQPELSRLFARFASLLLMYSLYYSAMQKQINV